MADQNEVVMPAGAKTGSRAGAKPGGTAGAPDTSVQDRSIGSILTELRNLTVEQVERIAALQHEKKIRFGEAAIALGFVSTDDVLKALSEQFHYPYAPEQLGPVASELVTLTKPFSAQAEAFRAVRSQIMMRLHSDSAANKALAVISPDSMDGKSFFAANLGVTMAQLGGRTLVVDADMRGPRQHEIFNVPNQAGLSSILSGRMESSIIHAVDGVPGLFVLPVGATPPNPLELVERSAFGLLLRELVGKFNHVIVDTPAAAYGSDATVIAARCGAALMLARKDASRVVRLRELADSLHGTPAKLAGVVYNEY